MPKPTERALKRKPMAVILIAWETGKGFETPDDHTFEWFEKGDNMAVYYDEAKSWNDNDVKEHGDLVHLIVEVTDTSTTPVTVGRMDVSAKDAAEGKSLLAKYKAGPSLLVCEPPAKPETPTDQKVVKAPKGAVKKPAAKAAGDLPAEGDAPKPKAVRRPAAKKAAAPTSGPKGAPAAKAANLKARLDAKKAEGKATEFVVTKAATA